MPKLIVDYSLWQISAYCFSPVLSFGSSIIFSSRCRVTQMVRFNCIDFYHAKDHYYRLHCMEE